VHTSLKHVQQPLPAELLACCIQAKDGLDAARQQLSSKWLLHLLLVK
jgi:hypothetical protein